MTGKLVPTGIHLFNYCIPCRRDVDGAFAVIDTSDEERGPCAIGIQKIHNLVGVDVRTIIKCQGDIANNRTVIDIGYICVSKDEGY